MTPTMMPNIAIITERIQLRRLSRSSFFACQKLPLIAGTMRMIEKS